MALQSNLPSWEKLSEKKLHDYKFCQTLQKTFKHPLKHEHGNFIVVNCSDSVQIIAETTDKRLVFVRQFRFGSEKFSLELPAGRLEKGESPIDGAVRELREETGYTGEKPTLVGELYTNPAFLENKIY
ncbi:MAG: NUDIX hydrolase, partial [Opitutales bacterium]|nr:NUDIX hydrolase [Opitutales bacterium]